MQSTAKVITVSNDSKTKTLPKNSQHTKSHPLIQMHSKIGNRAMQNLLKSTFIQAKQDKSQTNLLNQHTSFDSTSSGSQLDSKTRTNMESKFNYNFGNVRVHTDSKSNQTVERVHADAFTTGNDIFFGKNNYDTSSQKGTGLLAHELAHVVQQGGQKHEVMQHSQSVETGDMYEKEANNAAVAVLENRPVKIVHKVNKNPIQKGFFSDIGSALSSVGSAVVSGAKAVGGAVASGAEWLAEQVPVVGQLKKVLKKAGNVFGLILDNPVGFLGNLLKAIKGGFGQFFDNIGSHLKAGLMGWLFGALAGAGITMPEKFDLKSILGLVLQVLGLTYDRIRTKMVKLIGEKNVGLIEKVWGYVSTLIKEGPQGLWDQMKEEMSGVISSVMDSIKSWVVTTIIKKAAIKLGSLFNPVAGAIQALITIYDTVMFVVERMKQIISVVDAIINSIAMIAQGNTKAASDWIEKTLARIVPVAISFLASLIGLGGISGTIKGIITKIQAKVDVIVDKVLAKIVGLFRKGGKSKKGKEEEKPEKGLGSDVDKVLAEPPTPKSRNDKQKKQDLKDAKIIATKITKKVKTTKEVQEYFPKMINRFGLTEISWKNLGDPSAALYLKVNPDDQVDMPDTLLLNNDNIALKGAKPNDPKFDTKEIEGDKVGVEMRVKLTHEHEKGTPPGNVQNKLMEKVHANAGNNTTFKKGHLLHDDLGGKGEERNLYPITNSANQLHRNKVESHVIKWVNTKGFAVNYRVNMRGAHNPVLGNSLPEVTIQARAAALNADGKEVSSESINLNILSKANAKETKDDPTTKSGEIKEGVSGGSTMLSDFDEGKNVKWSDRTQDKIDNPNRTPGKKLATEWAKAMKRIEGKSVNDKKKILQKAGLTAPQIRFLLKGDEESKSQGDSKIVGNLNEKTNLSSIVN